MAVRAIRGAIQVDGDDRDAILEGTAELVTAVMSRNELTTDDDGAFDIQSLRAGTYTLLAGGPTMGALFSGQEATVGREMRNDVKEALAEAFYLNRLSMQPMTGAGDKEMTAFEVGQRVQEYIRQTLPLFEPVETDYNGGLCEVTFDLLMRGGAFGSYTDIPPSIRGQDIQFRFISPLSEAIEAQKAGKLAAAKQIIATVTDLDPTAPMMLDVHKAERDAMMGMGVPANWLRSEGQMKQIAGYQARLGQAQRALAAMQASANTVKTLGDAGNSVKNALTPPAAAPQ